jgi:hypothetical protein
MNFFGLSCTYIPKHYVDITYNLHNKVMELEKLIHYKCDLIAYINKMYVPSIVPQMLSKQSSKNNMVYCKHSPIIMLMYLLNNLFLSTRTSIMMATHFLIVDVHNFN